MRLGTVAFVVALVLAALPTPAPAPIAALSVSPFSLSFTSTVGSNPPTQSMTISNGGGSGMTWTVWAHAAWLSVAPSSGTDNATFVVTVDTTGLAPGVYTATIFTAAPGAVGSVRTTAVTLNLLPVTSPGDKSRRED
jgi:BACON domain-containing protein